MALDQILQDRQKKLEELRSKNIDPYPATAKREQAIAQARDMTGQHVSVAGRIRSLRLMGKIAFAHIEDESGKIQLFFALSDLQPPTSDLLRMIDIGDFIQAEGEVFTTQAGELSIKVKDFKLLTKSLRPIPSEHFGLKDTEEKLRKRYLDLLLDPSVRELFRKKSQFWGSVRKFMIDNGFMEVETPAMQAIPGGADARPFITHMNALNIDLYMRISLELPLKRLLVGGFEKVFEIGRIFRNEGIDDEHLQDYTQLEFYWAYADYNQLMEFVKKMYQAVIQETFGSLQLQWKGQTIDWSGDWPKKNYTDLLNENWSVDTDNMSVDDLYELAKKLNVQVEPNLGKGRLLDYLYKKTIRPKIIQPMFILNHPVEVEPLAKRLPENPNKVQRMQILAMGTELGKGFSELNDPLDQRQRFEEQMKLRDAGDEEAQMMDEDYVEAMEYGMPPNAGFGISERLFAMLVDRPIRETVFFPLMRPELQKTEIASSRNDVSSRHPERSSEGSQDFSKRMVIILSKELSSWQLTNAVSHISAYLGNKMMEPFDTGEYFESKDGKRLPRNSQYAVVTLSADELQLKDLLNRVEGSGLTYIAFVSEMIETTDDKKLEKMIGEKSGEEIKILGIGIFGEKEKLTEFTQGLELWK